HRALRLRPRPPHRPQEGHHRAQGQHPEVDLGPVPEGRAPSGRAVSGHRGQRADRGQLRDADGDAPRAVRRDRDHQPVRRHHLRPVRRPGRRPRPGPGGQHRHRRGDLRGRARLGPGHRRAGQGQPVRAAAGGGADARPPGHAGEGDPPARRDRGDPGRRRFADPGPGRQRQHDGLREGDREARRRLSDPAAGAPTTAAAARPDAFALTPLLLFLALFFGAGLYFTLAGEAMGFYQLSAPVAILPALALGAWLVHRKGLPAGDILLRGMGDPNIVLMCLIFLLAGAFAYVSKAIGAADAVVALGIGALPSALLLPGLFVLASLISLSIGTSMGTIAAVVPIAIGTADASGLDRGLVLGAVVGGAMFGDNLSVISDTTIAATRSQGAAMRDKFRENLKIALPAALATIVLLAFLGEPAPVPADEAAASPWLALPYVLVLVLAVAGLDVLVVLAVGLALAGGFGLLLTDGYDLVQFAGDTWIGFEGMVEILLLSLLIGGLGALMKAGGGLDWLA